MHFVQLSCGLGRGAVVSAVSGESRRGGAASACAIGAARSGGLAAGDVIGDAARAVRLASAGAAQSPPPGQYLIDPAQQPEPPTTPVYGGLTVFPGGITVPRWTSASTRCGWSEAPADGVWLGSTELVSRPVCRGTTTDSLWSDDVLFPLEPGIRLQLVGQISEQSDIEAVGWGLQQWSVGRTIYGDPDG